MDMGDYFMANRGKSSFYFQLGQWKGSRDEINGPQVALPIKSSEAVAEVWDSGVMKI
ncbi:hypothetical protein [Paenibacillus sp. D9]|uniref:hypothetical protein n=1 Tax=Paenibacillus sp. D9 TaxID=665792 RepID=UPI000ABB107C|nr:hypothetical protein [Paenibacillus sp. D9]